MQPPPTFDQLKKVSLGFDIESPEVTGRKVIDWKEAKEDPSPKTVGLNSAEGKEFALEISVKVHFCNHLAVECVRYIRVNCLIDHFLVFKCD